MHSEWAQAQAYETRRRGHVVLLLVTRKLTGKPSFETILQLFYRRDTNLRGGGGEDGRTGGRAVSSPARRVSSDFACQADRIANAYGRNSSSGSVDASRHRRRRAAIREDRDDQRRCRLTGRDAGGDDRDEELAEARVEFARHWEEARRPTRKKREKERKSK